MAAATLSSTGTSAFFLHPAEAIHGDLGAIREDDVVLALSHSGETEELVRLLESVRRLGARVIAMTGSKSTIERNRAVRPLVQDAADEIRQHCARADLDEDSNAARIHRLDHLDKPDRLRHLGRKRRAHRLRLGRIGGGQRVRVHVDLRRSERHAVQKLAERPSRGRDQRAVKRGRDRQSLPVQCAERTR